MARFAFVRWFFADKNRNRRVGVYYANETTTNVFLSWKFCRRDDRCNGDGIKLNVAIKLETVAFVAKEWLIEGKMMERD